MTSNYWHLETFYENERCLQKVKSRVVSTACHRQQPTEQEFFHFLQVVVSTSIVGNNSKKCVFYFIYPESATLVRLTFVIQIDFSKFSFLFFQKNIP